MRNVYGNFDFLDDDVFTDDLKKNRKKSNTFNYINRDKNRRSSHKQESPERQEVTAPVIKALPKIDEDSNEGGQQCNLKSNGIKVTKTD